MRKSKFNWNYLTLLLTFVGTAFLMSCGDDEPGPGDDDGGTTVLASFGTEIDGLSVEFVNASSGADTYAWDFGDDNTSTDENPTHEYAAEGTYSVTLTASSGDVSDVFMADVVVTEPGKLLSFISGKDWQLVRGAVASIALGPAADAETTWSYQAGPWFTLIDDSEGNVCAGVRASAMNDIYSFNADGTYSVNFNGDFWGEYGIWLGTDFHETAIDISGGSLPPNAAGNNVDAFISGSWNYSIDENAQTISVTGAGAHIINPRYKNESSSHEVGEGITYQIFKTVEGTDVDSLVIFIETFDNDFGSEPRQYMTLASYKTSAAPDLQECGGFVCTDYADEISAGDITHDFATEEGFTGVDVINSSSTLEYGVEVAGVTAMKYTRTDADGGFTDYKMQSTDSDIRFDTDGTYDFSVVSVDVYIPSADNTFDGEGLINQVMVKLADISCTEQFWTNWATIAQTEIALDTWTTLTFDFTGQIDDSNASSGITDHFDTIILEFGGSGHSEAGVVYYSNLQVVEAE